MMRKQPSAASLVPVLIEAAEAARAQLQTVAWRQGHAAEAASLKAREQALRDVVSWITGNHPPGWNLKTPIQGL